MIHLILKLHEVNFEMPFCPKCGSTVDENAQYCPNCGTLLKPEQAPGVPPTAGAPPRQRSFLERIYASLMLDPSLYEEVESDRAATTQALLVVAIGSISHGIGNALAQVLRGSAAAGVGTGFFGGLVSALFGWLIWSFITYLVGTRVFGGKANYGELLRTIGFANAPSILGFFTFIPILGGLVSFAIWVWGLAAMVIAVRQALDFSTGQAIMTAVVGFIAAIIFFVVVGLLLALPFIFLTRF